MDGCWEKHKDEIRMRYYSTDQNVATLKSIMAHMKDKYNFDRGKPQYVRQFKKWGFRKSLSAPEWKCVHGRIEKRAKEKGKKSVVYHAGRLIPAQKVLKAKRHNFTTTEERFRPEEPVRTPERLSICTPTGDSTPYVLINNLPSLQLLAHLQTLVSTFPCDTTQDTHNILDLTPLSNLQPTDFRDLFKVSHSGVLSTSALRVLHNCLNNHISLYDASAMMDIVLKDENRRAFSILMSAQAPATKAIARILLPSAIGSADVAMVKLLLATNISPDFALDDGQTTPINVAVEQKNIEMTKLLLSFGADVNLPASSGHYMYVNSPLTVAVQSGRIDIMRLLLDKGADVNAKRGGDSDQGPLRTAVEYGNLETVNVLLDAGAHIDTRRKDVENSLTPLQIALESEDDELVQLLLSRGADVNIPRTHRNRSVLDTAVSTGNVELVQLILSHDADTTGHSTEGRSLPTTETPEFRQNLIGLLSARGASDLIPAMEIASDNGDMEIIRLCSEAGASLEDDPARACKRMAIKAGVTCGEYDFVQQLLNSGNYVDVDAPAFDGDADWITPLQLAARNGRLDLVQLLGRFGARFESPPAASGWSLIQGAASSGNVDLVKYLLSSGADVNAHNAKSYLGSPLASAARLANLELLRVLQEAGLDMAEQGPDALIAAIRSLSGHPTNSSKDPPDPNSSTIIRFLVNLLGTSNLPSGDTTTMRAAVPFDSWDLRFMLRCPQFTDLLLQRGLLDASAALVEAIRFGDLELVTLLLLCDADVNKDPLKDPRALEEAVKIDRLDILNHLLAHGANPREKARALQSAASRSKIECVRALIDFGADVNADPLPLYTWSRTYRTALQAAAENGFLEVVQLLIANGAEVERLSVGPDDQGTALQFAAIKGHIAVANELIQKGANVNALPIGEHGRTALEGAAEHGRLDMIQLLLNLEAETPGSRALRFAKREGHEGVVALLLENGFEDLGFNNFCSDDDEYEDEESEDDDYW